MLVFKKIYIFQICLKKENKLKRQVEEKKNYKKEMAEILH